MIKYFSIIFTFVLFIGCKSPVADLPTYELPDADDSITGEVLPPEDTFIGPNDHIGNGGDSDIAIEVIDNNLHIAYSNSNKTITFGEYSDSEWTLTDTGLRIHESNQPLDLIHIDNTPYMAFADGNGNGKLRFMTYNGSEWVNVLEANHLSDFSAPAISAVGVGTKIYIAFNEYNDDVPGDRTIGVLEYDTNKPGEKILLPTHPYAYPPNRTHLSNVDGKLFLTHVDQLNNARTFQYDEEKVGSSPWISIGLPDGTFSGVLIQGWQDAVNNIEGAEIDDVPHAVYASTNKLQLVQRVEREPTNLSNDFSWAEKGDAIVDGKAVAGMGFTQINNVAYVAYADPHSRDRLRVQYLTEAGYWDDVDSTRAYLSDGAVSHIDIVSANGVLYVAAIEETEGNVKKVKVVSFKL